MTKKEAILTQKNSIELINDTGLINITVGESIKLEYQKISWREWCLLHHREEADKIIIEVENTSFTGESGCDLTWNLQVTKESTLKLTQKAGKIVGVGNIKSLTTTLAAGTVAWSKGEMPVQINVAAGSVKLTDMNWTSEGSSKVALSTGNVEITSPKEAQVTTKISNSVGIKKNDFTEQGKKHTLVIQVAFGQVRHTF